MSLLLRIPPISYTLQNILFSLASVVVAGLGLLFTTFVLLPISLLRFLFTLTFTIFRRESHIQLGDGQRRNVLIIGASHGIGRNILAQYSTELDTSIVAVSRHREDLEETKKQIQENPSGSNAEIHIETLDIGDTSASGIRETMEKWQTQYGPFTHVYSVAGVTADPKGWNLGITLNIIQTNIIGTVCCVLTAFDLMQRNRKGGRICIIGSQAGLQTPANMIIYSSTKAFINTFALCIRVLALSSRSPLATSDVGSTNTTFEGNPEGGAHDGEKALAYLKAPPIDITVVMPGFIDTRLTALLRINGAITPSPFFRDPGKIAKYVKERVEQGGTGAIIWPWGQGVVMWASQALNPLCDELVKIFNSIIVLFKV
ncbi:hypothetical protein M422DRAFT_238884 [Sphaerobolus stellatus SS14]|nr:hypothetical protein M422DRAFT_238884 [Sphaerobolus stellatus SS14]